MHTDDDTRYQIVFDGSLVPGMSEDIVKANLARLFQCDVAKIEPLFAGGPVVMKRGLAEAQADAYLAQLEAVGAIAQKVQAQEQQGRVAQPPAPPPPPPSPSPQEEEDDDSRVDPDFRILALRGRLGRARYLVWLMLLNMVNGAVGSELLSLFLVAVFFLVFVIRRLHDFNRSGWWAVLLLCTSMLSISLFGSMASVRQGIPWTTMALGVALSLPMWALLFIPGTRGKNDYGLPAPPNSLGVLVAAWILPTLNIL
ncbi:MAG: DUF805 domain-containing protein, partial [Zoogloeaceae bacterium]|nr:DUF805 domain-containing protein [Zoogloeaceae bacterium]